MAVQTLSDLRERVKSWANRKDLSDTLIDDFINVALARSNRILRIPVLEGVIDITLDSDGNADVPRDYVEAKMLKVTSGSIDVTLERKDLHFVEETKSKQTGVPLYFSRKGESFILAPKPADITTATLYYYIVLNSLSADSDTNWFVTDAPELLVYGALVELFFYVKNPAAASQWEGKYRGSLQELQHMADESDWSGKTLAVTPYS